VRIVTFKIDNHLLERIDRLAERDGLSRSELIRKAIIMYLGGGSRRKKKEMFKVKYVILT